MRTKMVVIEEYKWYSIMFSVNLHASFHLIRLTSHFLGMEPSGVDDLQSDAALSKELGEL